MITKEKYTDVRIRGIPRELARRWRSAIVADGISMVEWFELRAAQTAEAHENRVRAGKGGKP